MSKVLINLHSAQTIPNYIAIKEIKPDLVIAFATEKFKDQVTLFESSTRIEHVYKEINAYDIESNFVIIQKLIDDLGEENELLINYTGGTKVMAISVILKILLSTNQKLSFIYVNTFGNSIEYLELSENKQLTTFNSDISVKIYLETYINLKGERLKSVEHRLTDKIIERYPLSEQLLINNSLSKIFNKQKTFFEGRNVKRENFIDHNNFELSWNNDSIDMKIKDNIYHYLHNDGGVYFTGGWLEEYVFDD